MACRWQLLFETLVSRFQQNNKFRRNTRSSEKNGDNNEGIKKQ